MAVIINFWGLSPKVVPKSFRGLSPKFSGAVPKNFPDVSSGSGFISRGGAEARSLGLEDVCTTFIVLQYFSALNSQNTITANRERENKITVRTK